MLAVSYLANGYVWWLVLEGVFAIIGSFTLHWATMREFPYLKTVKTSLKSLQAKYPFFVTKIKQMFFHKIGGFVLEQTSPLIIYAYASLTLVAIYGNYMLIVTGMLLLIRSIFYSIGGGIGNLVASGNEENIRKVFKELFSLRFFITSVITFCVYTLAESFIILWIGPEYLLPKSTLLLICILLFLQLYRLNTESFVNAYGLFSDIWAPGVEAALNLGFSILLGYFFSLDGIITGVIISLIFVVIIWKPYFLMTRKLRGFGTTYVKLFLSHGAIFIVVSALCIFFIRKFNLIVQPENWLEFIILGIVIAVTYAAVIGIILYAFCPGMRCVTKRIIRLQHQ